MTTSPPPKTAATDGPPAHDVAPPRPKDLAWTLVQDGRRTHATFGKDRAKVFIVVSCLGFLAYFSWVVFRLPREASGLAYWFPWLFSAMVAVIIYAGICVAVNNIHARFDGDAFTFRREPLPQRGNVRLPLDELQGFSVHFGTYVSRGREHQVWDARAELRTGRRVRLELGHVSQEAAVYIVWQLQRALERARHEQTQANRAA